MIIEGDDLQPILMAMNTFCNSHTCSHSMGEHTVNPKVFMCFHCEFKNRCLTKNDSIKLNNHCETLRRQIERELNKFWKSEKDRTEND